MYEWIFKLYPAVVYDLRICMKEDNPGPNNEGDNSREIIICAGLCDFSTCTSSIFFLLYWCYH